MLSNFLHTKLVWIPSVCYIPNYYLQSCFHLYLMSFCCTTLAIYLHMYLLYLWPVFSDCQAFVAERAGCESPILEVTGSKPIDSKVLVIRGSFLFLLFHFILWLRLCFNAVSGRLEKCIFYKLVFI